MTYNQVVFDNTFSYVDPGGAQTLSGTGTIDFGTYDYGGAQNRIFVQVGGLTIGSGITINGPGPGATASDYA